MKNVLVLVMASASLAWMPMQAGALDLPGYGGGKYTVPVTSLKEARFKATLRQQYDFSCGSAAVATLLTYQYGFPVSEQQVFEEMFARGNQEKIRREGFSLLDIKQYLANHGFLADGFEQPLQKLADTGLPAIVLIVEKGYHHFVVIKGMQDGRILVGDPSTGTRAIPRKNFETIWVNKLMFVIHTQQQGKAIFNNEADWRVAPRAPLSAALNNDGLGNVTLPKMGPGDF
jgi:predicted double-glycine peptidase